MKLGFSREVFEEYSNIQFMNIRPVGAELLHGDRRMDGRTGVTKLNSRFSQFWQRA